MKKLKIISIIMTVFLVATIFSGCRRINENKEEILIVTSFYPMYVFTKNITDGADGVRVVNMTSSNTGCLHDYSLLPKDIKLLEEADAFVINGGGMEGFMEKVYENTDTLKVITASEGIDFIKHNDELNSHVWTYVPYAQKEILNIEKGLSELSPENISLFKANAQNYIKSINQVHEKFEELKDDNVKMVVTHEAFDYMGKGYGIEIKGHILSGHNTQTSAGELSGLLDKIKNEEITGIFIEPQYSDSMANAISNETGVPIYTLDPMVTGDDEYAGVYETIKSAIKQKASGE